MSELTVADLQLLERLNDQPHLNKRLEQLLSMVEDAGIVKADEAERRVREEIRRLGNETLTGWAQTRCKQSANEAIFKEDWVRSGKKLDWHTTFGEIQVTEPVSKRPGKRLRPFSQTAPVRCRGGSLPLQRAVVDLGAEHAFGQVPDKLMEHYGIHLPTSTIRRLTEEHAQRIRQGIKIRADYPEPLGYAYVVAQMDDSMIPIVARDEKAKDKRQDKTLVWKEARLC